MFYSNLTTALFNPSVHTISILKLAAFGEKFKFKNLYFYIHTYAQPRTHIKHVEKNQCGRNYAQSSKTFGYVCKNR